ncbi:MAG: glycosyltransferase family protein, partial [Patescibacteria group bacterium]
DFATITPALMKIMEKYPRVELVLVGALETENKLNKFESRIVRIGLAPRDKHYENLSRIDINLIPLVSDDPFTESKSELKYFEAGIVKVPSVAQDNETYRGCIIDGADGFLAKNQEEWIEKLEKLILDKTLRQSMGKKAYEKSLEDYTVKNSHNKEYYDFLRSKI